MLLQFSFMEISLRDKIIGHNDNSTGEQIFITEKELHSIKIELIIFIGYNLVLACFNYL